MRITFDRSANAAYIYLAAEGSEEFTEKGGQTYLVEPPHIKGSFILEFNKSGRLVCIEVLDASKVLPYELLGKAERL